MTHKRLFLTALAVALVLPLWAAAGADAQGPRIDRLEIMVLDLGKQERVGTVLPGQTFDMNQGETLRFRMVAIPNGSGERYPATRFWVDSGKSRIKTEAANVEVGNITITAKNANNSRERTRVSYEIVDRGHNIPNNLRRGSFFLDVTGQGRAGNFRPNPNPQAPTTQRGVVTIYEHRNYTGHRAIFDSSVADLRDVRFPLNAASSVRVLPGCSATLFTDTNFRGRSVTVTQDSQNLRYTPVGDDTVGSVRVDCDNSGNSWSDRQARDRYDDRRYDDRGYDDRRRDNRGSTGSVTIYEHQNFRGDSETFWTGRLANLKGTGIGVNRASSVRIEGNCRVTLYQDTDFEGRVTVLTRDVTDLSNERVGNDTLSSIIVDCG